MNKALKPIAVIGSAVFLMVVVSLYMQGRGQEIVPWREDVTAAKLEAAKNRKPMLLYFTAVWCSPCDYMKHTTFADSSVKEALDKFVPVKIDVDRNKELAAQYGAPPLPQFYVIDADGHIVRNIVGGMDSDEFVNWLNGK